MSRYGETGETGYDKEEMFYDMKIFTERHGLSTLLRILADVSKKVNDTGEWISVNDRLPSDMSTVLIAHKNGVSFGWWNGNYWTRGASTKQRPIKTVTHWMQLPEPPKE